MAEQQLTLIGLGSSEREDYKEVMKDLSRTCHDCRLGVTVHPNNRGIIWRGNPEAKIAVVGEAPGDTETEKGLPLVGRSGILWSRWAQILGLNEQNDLFITNVAQCQPDKVRNKEGKLEQRAPDETELKACFGPRCLRILRAMPNLKCVITLGWVAAKQFLGGEPIAKTHQNNWFKTTLLPGVAIYCMVHPAYILREPNPTKSGEAMTGLENFKREYLELKKIHPLIEQMDEEDTAELL